MAQARSSAPQILVITGLSGSGKTHVSRALEDLGWFCVDNLPSALIPRFVELISGSRRLRRSALVVDIRESEFLSLFPRIYAGLRRNQGLEASLLFLEADEKVLLRRFSETRRPHPLAVNQPVLDGIREEREVLRPIRQIADLILDTSAYTVHELRDHIRERYETRSEGPAPVICVTSFGFKNGLPPEADLVFDVRFLPNPNFVPALKRLTGRHREVVVYLQDQPDTEKLLKRLRSFIGFVLPRYLREGKSYLTIAIGCTGGRHRSVMVAEALAEAIGSRRYSVKVRHRDIKLT